MTNNFQNKKNRSNSNKPHKIPNTGLEWWKIIIAFFLIWMIYSYFMKSFEGPPRINIPYSQFKQEVSDKNVAEITIQGDKISGKFQNKFIMVYKIGDTTAYKNFSTIKPSIQDPELMTLLEKSNVTINAEEKSDNSWISYFIFLGLPLILMFAYFSYMRRKTQGKGGGMMGGGIFGVGKSTAKRFKKEKSNITFNDVAGLNNAKNDLQEIIDYLKEPGKFSALGANMPKGILLMGPPGTGKTLLARATAGEANVTFYSISGSEFIEMFVGVGASRVRNMFENAKKEAPSVIFIECLRK